MRLHPPSLREIRDNLRLLAADWRRAGVAMRYYVVTNLVANAVMVACSAASLTAMLFERQQLQLMLLAAATAGALQAAISWAVLQKRFKIRYELL